jgi:uncharacterized membrane protein HdeD (DUF308 family)
MTKLIKKSGGLMVLRGVLALLFGLFALLNPEGAGRLFITLFAIYLLVDGLINIVIALSNTDTREWGLPFALGVLELAVAAATYFRPDITATVLAILIALWLFLKGAIEMFLGFNLRRELEGEWFLVLSGAFSIIAGFTFLILPFTDSVAAIFIFGFYAVGYGALYIADGYIVRKHAAEIAEVVEKVEQEQAGA